eukprot:879466-Amorphochlora_amoeboformis.AAC.1
MMRGLLMSEKDPCKARVAVARQDMEIYAHQNDNFTGGIDERITTKWNTMRDNHVELEITMRCAVQSKSLGGARHRGLARAHDRQSPLKSNLLSKGKQPSRYQH